MWPDLTATGPNSGPGRLLPDLLQLQDVSAPTVLDQSAFYFSTVYMAQDSCFGFSAHVFLSPQPN